MANWPKILNFKLSRGVDRGLTLREIEKVWEMSLIHTPDIEMAHSLDFSMQSWLAYKMSNPEIQKWIDKARAEGANGLRKAQFEAALHGNVTMQMWLGKYVLGQREDFSSSTSQPAALADISPESRQHLLELRDAIYKKQQPIDVQVELTPVKTNNHPGTVGRDSHE